MRRLLPFLLIVAVACAEAPAQDATGADVFTQICARCHGDDLGGGIGPALGSGSPVPDLPEDYLTRVITRGKGAMPAFGSTLSTDQIERVVAYLRQQEEP